MNRSALEIIWLVACFGGALLLSLVLVRQTWGERRRRRRIKSLEALNSTSLLDLLGRLPP
jgi:hypothetical protein